MHFPGFDWYPARRHLRQFAWGTALFLAVLSWADGASLWLRLAAAFLFAVGTVWPGVLRWPYVGLLFLLYLFAQLSNRLLRTIAPHAARRRRDPARQAKPFQDHHERQPATGTHG